MIGSRASNVPRMHSPRRTVASIAIGAVAALAGVWPAAGHTPAGSDTTTSRRQDGDKPTTMVLRSAPADDAPDKAPPANVDPALAMLAGLLLARTSADIWFRTRFAGDLGHTGAVVGEE